MAKAPSWRDSRRAVSVTSPIDLIDRATRLASEAIELFGPGGGGGGCLPVLQADSLPFVVQAIAEALVLGADHYLEGGGLRELVRRADTAGRRRRKVEDAHEKERFVEAVAIVDSVRGDGVICLEDGRPMQMMKRHLLNSYNMTVAEYRTKWGLDRYQMRSLFDETGRLVGQSDEILATARRGSYGEVVVEDWSRLHVQVVERSLSDLRDKTYSPGFEAYPSTAPVYIEKRRRMQVFYGMHATSAQKGEIERERSRRG